MVSQSEVKSKLDLLEKMKSHQRIDNLTEGLHTPFDYHVVCDHTNNPNPDSNQLTVDLFLNYPLSTNRLPMHYREVSDQLPVGGSITRGAMIAAAKYRIWSRVTDLKLFSARRVLDAIAKDLAYMIPRNAEFDEPFRVNAKVETVFGSSDADTRLTIQFSYGASHCIHLLDFGQVVESMYYQAVADAASKYFSPIVLYHLRRRNP